MRRDSAMPLPKSVLCSSCKKTYPEGWKRCPYCGHDPLRDRLEAQSRKFMQRKVQEFEQRTGARDRRPGGGRPPRPDARPQQPQRERGRERDRDNRPRP
jgi:hypothetical protein